MKREEDPGVVVPVKSPAESKTRLATCLSPAERRELVLALVRHMADVLTRLPCDAQPLFVSESEPVRRHVDRAGHPCVSDPPDAGTPGEIVDRVITDRFAAAPGTLVLPIDLPLASADTLGSLLEAGRDVPVLMVPDRAGKGTNALWRRTPSTPPCQWRGTRSFRAHRRAVRRQGIEHRVMHPPRITFDLDTPSDLEALRREGRSLPDPLRSVLEEASDRAG